MTQLTKETFEQALQKLGTKDDIIGVKNEIAELRTHVDASVVGVKNEIAALRTEIQEGFGSVDLKLDAIHQLLDVRKEVDDLKGQMQEIRQALNLKH